MKPLRLNLYNKYITNFDYLDRNLTKVKNFENISLKTNVYQLSSKLQILTLGLVLEVLTQQRFLIKTKKNLSRTNYLEISICKNKLLMLLDVCLISVLLSKLNELNFSYEKLVSKMHVLISNQIIDNLNLININKSFININLNKKQLK